MPKHTPEEARQLWSIALRSGNYQQGSNALCSADDNRYCCLGVACEVYQQHEGDLTVKENAGLQTYDRSSGYLPKKVAQWINITAKGNLTDTGRDRFGDDALTYLNDIRKLSFDQIAEVIDADCLEPFDGRYNYYGALEDVQETN